ncbi:MAG: TadE/TadG family type IV pilus assembly protein [Saccharofermentanales bacterium]
MGKLIRAIRRFGSEEKGSSLVIIALAFTILSVAAALVIDLGLAYYRTAELENATDAAALAAGQLLPVDITDTIKINAVKQTAIEYAAKNGVDDLTLENVLLQNPVNGFYTKITVNITTRVETSFAKVLGIHSIDITRDSKVKIAPVYKVYGAVPFAIKQDVLDYCIATGMTNNIALKFGGGSGLTGDYGVIDLDGVRSGGANDVELWLNYGFTSMLSSGESLYPVEPGTMDGLIETAVIDRYNSCTHFPNDGGCTTEHFVSDCPRVMTVPVVVALPNKYVKIVGFAAFVLEPIQDSGFVYGSLVQETISGIASGTSEVGDAGDYWLYSLILTE